MDGVTFALLTGFVASVSPAGSAAAVVSVSIGQRPCLALWAGTAAARVVQGSVAAVAALALLSRFGAGAFILAPWQYVVIGFAGVGLVISGTVSLLRGRGHVREFSEDELFEPAVAFGTGFGIVISSTRQWLFATAVVARLGDGRVAPAFTAFAFGLYILAASWFTLSLLAYRWARPHGGEETFTRIHDLVMRHAHQLGPAIVVAFGLLFVGLAIDGYARLGMIDLLGDLVM